MYNIRIQHLYNFEKITINHFTKLFFLVMRSLKVHFLSNFQICHRVLLPIVTMLCIISPLLTYFITSSLYLLIPLNTSPNRPNSLSSGNNQSVFCVSIEF